MGDPVPACHRVLSVAGFEGKYVAVAIACEGKS